MTRMYTFTCWTVFFLIAICVATLGYLKTTTSNPIYGKYQLSGSYGPVTIKRDNHGIPHIDASLSDLDAFFALGYTHAQDRFWQMEFQRRIASGTLSEVLGPKAISKDKFLRTMGFYEAAKQTSKELDHNTRRIIRHYTEGVNAFLNHGNLPLQFKLLHYKPKPWTDVDTIAWEKLLAWDLQGSWREKVKNAAIRSRYGASAVRIIHPFYSKHAPTILSNRDLAQSNLIDKRHAQKNKADSHIRSATVTVLEKTMQQADAIRKVLGYDMSNGKGSNNWVLSGKFTQSGKPLLACDPHLRLMAPSIWYLAELKGPNLHVNGATLPGMPLVLIGHNDHIAWGVTNMDPDVQDLYIESPKTKFNIRHELIKVKGQPPIDWVVRSSKHGPIISDVLPLKDFQYPVALKWTALLPHDKTVKSYVKINYAHDWHSFVEALRDYVVPSQNFVYADTKGNIGYYASGKIPTRPGWESDYPVGPNEHKEWGPYIPFQKMPHVFNPPEGFIATSNNKVVTSQYPYKLASRTKNSGLRARRLHTLLTTIDGQATVSDMKKIQNDVYSTLWSELKPMLLKTPVTDAKEKAALKRLVLWNGYATKESVAATIFNDWYAHIANAMMPRTYFSKKKDEPEYIVNQLKSNGIFCRKLARAKNCQDLLQKTLTATIKDLTHRLGSDMNRWHWARVHKAKFHMMALGEVPSIAWIWNRRIATPGDPYTLNVGTYHFHSLSQYFGASYRQIIDLNDFDNSLYIQSMGQSGDPFNPHYSDFMKPWSEGQYVKMVSVKPNSRRVHSLRLLPMH